MRALDGLGNFRVWPAGCRDRCDHSFSTLPSVVVVYFKMTSTYRQPKAAHSALLLEREHTSVLYTTVLTSNLMVLMLTDLLFSPAIHN